MVATNSAEQLPTRPLVAIADENAHSDRLGEVRAKGAAELIHAGGLVTLGLQVLKLAMCSRTIASVGRAGGTSSQTSLPRRAAITPS